MTAVAACPQECHPSIASPADPSFYQSLRLKSVRAASAYSSCLRLSWSKGLASLFHTSRYLSYPVSGLASIKAL